MYSDEFKDAEFSFPRALAVSEVNEFIKRIFDGIPQLTDLYIRGEISNFKNHYGTGHFYFTLKDESSAIRAVMFRSYASRVRFVPENGMKVVVHGRISAYPRDGQYQIYCDSMEPLGTGALFAAFEQLKKKLSAEGLFDEGAKKRLPPYPNTVGVVTSATGAAVRDIINISQRRCPAVQLILYPALVQGDGAPESIIKGIEYFNSEHRVDVIIIGRGGGSIEDLWAFNSEALARAIYASDVPIISAVGHETDFTISDFVSDVRAPTPSAAAEIALPDISELRMRIASLRSRQENAINSAINTYYMLLKKLSGARVLNDPNSYIEDRTLQLGALSDRLMLSYKRAFEDKRNKLSSLAGMLNTLSPLSVLSRGYGAVADPEGKIIKSISAVSVGDVVSVSLGDGRFDAEVKALYGGNKNE